MSYNLERRIERQKMKEMIKEFASEAGITAKQLDMAIAAATKSKITGLRDRFDKMLGLATGKYKLPEEVGDTTSFNSNEVE